MKQHNCIKCSEKYESSDIDPYYCDGCKTEKIRIAEEVDKKMANRPKKQVKSDNQILEETGVLNIAPGAYVKIGTPKPPQNNG